MKQFSRSTEMKMKIWNKMLEKQVLNEVQICKNYGRTYRVALGINWTTYELSRN